MARGGHCGDCLPANALPITIFAPARPANRKAGFPARLLGLLFRVALRGAMDPDKTKWRAGDWQAYALALEKAHQSALDGWGITVAELEKHAKIIADLRDNNERLHKHIDLLDTVVAL